MSGLRNPTARSLRKLLEAVLRTSSELDAFLCDQYPDVNRNLSSAMDRTQRVTKLLETRPTVDVLARLRESHAESVTQHERLLVEDSGRRLLKDEFELYEIFHEGPMSKLYRAWQRSTKVWRAVKELKMPLRDERSRRRFLQEVEILAKLQSSQHIVRIIDADVEDHTPWLAMELLIGESLAEYLARTGALSWDETYRLLADICNPLSLAHRQQPAIVHRDIKPENIFLQSVDKGSEQPSSPLYTVQLLDFGLAKVLWESRPALSSRGGIGTHPWMAPEQFDDEGVISPATDVWALGLLAFNLLSGLHYFPAGNKKKLATAAIVAQIFREPLVPATERVRQLGVSVQLPAAFDRWFGKCVHRDASERYATAGDAMTAFRTIVYRPQNLARSPSQPPIGEDATPPPGPALPVHRPELVHIPAGHFQMGSTPAEDPERWLDEVVRRVHIAQPFLLAQTPVTQAQYDAVMGLTPAYFKGDLRRPVESISFLDALQYCNELSKREALEPCYVFTANTVGFHAAVPPERAGYRLPTEEEWEYAARANQRHRYAGAGEPDQVAWYADNAAAMTQPVGQKPPNVWQLFDMSGNVFEWVFTPYRATHQDSSGIGPATIELAEELVIRGGAWSSSADMLRLSHRLAMPSDWKTSYLGFRIARSLG